MAATRTTTTTVTLVRWADGPSAGDSLDLETLAREAGLHPELVRRFVALGLITPAPGATAGAARFPRAAVEVLAGAERLRRDLGIGYAGAVLACELLARIDVLERRLARYESRGDRPRS